MPMRGRWQRAILPAGRGEKYENHGNFQVMSDDDYSVWPPVSDNIDGIMESIRSSAVRAKLTMLLFAIDGRPYFGSVPVVPLSVRS